MSKIAQKTDSLNFKIQNFRHNIFFIKLYITKKNLTYIAVNSRLKKAFSQFYSIFERLIKT